MLERERVSALIERWSTGVRVCAWVLTCEEERERERESVFAAVTKSLQRETFVDVTFRKKKKFGDACSENFRKFRSDETFFGK